MVHSFHLVLGEICCFVTVVSHKNWEKVGPLTLFNNHAGTMTWKQDTDAVTGLETAKQFFGGTINFYWN